MSVANGTLLKRKSRPDVARMASLFEMPDICIDSRLGSTPETQNY